MDFQGTFLLLFFSELNTLWRREAESESEAPVKQGPAALRQPFRRGIHSKRYFQLMCKIENLNKNDFTKFDLNKYYLVI